MSALSGILDAIVATEQAAGLTIGGTLLNVVKRKLPKAEEGVDAAYQVTVSGAEVPERCRRIGFGGRWLVAYAVEITLIIPTADALTNLDAVTNWREAVRARYLTNGTLSAAGVTRVEPDDGTLFDRSKFASGYDFDQLVFTLWTYETRA